MYLVHATYQFSLLKISNYHNCYYLLTEEGYLRNLKVFVKTLFTVLIFTDLKFCSLCTMYKGLTHPATLGHIFTIKIDAKLDEQYGLISFSYYLLSQKNLHKELSKIVLVYAPFSHCLVCEVSPASRV